MKRRAFLTGSAAALAAPSVGRAQAKSTIRFVPEADLAVLDPVWTTASQTTQHTFLIYDTLWGQDAAYRPQPQMLEGHVVEDGGKTWKLTLRDGLKWHDGERVLARDCAASIRRWARRDAFGQALLAAADEIGYADDRTIVLRLKYPFPVPDALSKTTANVCAMMPERLAETDPFKQVTDPTGSGPFRFKADERVPGARVVYERNTAYVPRSGGTPAGTAGPKVAYFDRVEWTIMPDASTAANALQAGEIDWLLTPNADLVNTLRARKDLVVRVISPTGSISCMRFNQTQPPFDNPAIRRAFFPAIVQSDYMIAMNGEDRTRWRDGVGYFCPDLPMASKAGMEALTGPRSVDVAKRALEQAGYKGERVVLLGPADVPYAKILADVTADLYKRLGLNLDYQVMDWGTLVQRRAKTDPLDKGGWSVYQTNWPGPDQANPAGHVFLRGNGKDAAPGWAVSPRIEELRIQWLRTQDLEAQKKIAEQIQLQAFQDVPYIPLGQVINPTAYRANLTGMIEGVPVFWNIRRT
ncbi:ABC transporter substrate-binding protein [Limobrevibacterium gyesilva]|uniref:ABC transporter substrate-binding protein n=1 Tax=Limobrevibacterium gyesilva TaxID=2991712 RepID=A0AA41YN11_9PROT|nr:ABC transporter substrate-binding protein [Limobrevibacterium gyesilva]MCW3473498.1 ABC transporter substrate-binding protein [Limobrevibacterium gyesilva]